MGRVWAFLSLNFVFPFLGCPCLPLRNIPNIPHLRQLGPHSLGIGDEGSGCFLMIRGKVWGLASDSCYLSARAGDFTVGQGVRCLSGGPWWYKPQRACGVGGVVHGEVLVSPGIPHIVAHWQSGLAGILPIGPSGGGWTEVWKI